MYLHLTPAACFVQTLVLLFLLYIEREVVVTKKKSLKSIIAKYLPGMVEAKSTVEDSARFHTQTHLHLLPLGV